MGEDGYDAFNIIVAEDTTALTESILRYAEQSARSYVRVNELKVCMEAMMMQPKPLGL